MKIIVAVVLIAVGAYFLFFNDSNWGKKKGGLNFREKERPTVTFVPPGTPGAKTWDEIQKENTRRANGR